jgi:hypothetical protein
MMPSHTLRQAVSSYDNLLQIYMTFFLSALAYVSLIHAILEVHVVAQGGAQPRRSLEPFTTTTAAANAHSGRRTTL